MMQIDGSRRQGLARAATVVILTGLVAGCVGPSEPAPVYFRGAAEPVIAPMPAPPAQQVIVKRGQTLDGYAYTYHVPKSAIIAANGLRPPYKLEAGRRLLIPNPRGAVQQAMVPPPQQQAAAPQPPRSPEAIAAPASHPPQTIFTTPAPPLPPAQPTPAQASPPPAAPPPAAAKSQPDIIPLDSPPPAKEAEAAPPKPSAPLTPPQQPPPQAAMPLTTAPPPAAA
ncbi:MAG: LysM peptidoglycan-binding domain-containing protein, partial [Stellaceae bacterium]